jgi:hypothetical protein
LTSCDDKAAKVLDLLKRAAWASLQADHIHSSPRWRGCQILPSNKRLSLSQTATWKSCEDANE